MTAPALCDEPGVRVTPGAVCGGSAPALPNRRCANREMRFALDAACAASNCIDQGETLSVPKSKNRSHTPPMEVGGGGDGAEIRGKVWCVSPPR